MAWKVLTICVNLDIVVGTVGTVEVRLCKHRLDVLPRNKDADMASGGRGGSC